MKQFELLHSLFVGIDVSMKENVVHAMPFSPEDHPGMRTCVFLPPTLPRDLQKLSKKSVTS